MSGEIQRDLAAWQPPLAAGVIEGHDVETPRRGLMPHGGNRGPWSRDYDLPSIPCACSPCVCNSGGFCTMPSSIKINAAGTCETGLKYLNPEKKEPHCG